MALLLIGAGMVGGCAAHREAKWRDAAERELAAAQAGNLPEGRVLLFIHRGDDLRLLKVTQAEEGGGIRIELPASQIDDGKAWGRASTLFTEHGGGFVDEPGRSTAGRPGGQMTTLGVTFADPDAAMRFIPRVFDETWGIAELTDIETMRIRADYVQQAIALDHLRKHNARPLRR